MRAGGVKKRESKERLIKGGRAKRAVHDGEGKESWIERRRPRYILSEHIERG